MAFRPNATHKKEGFITYCMSLKLLESVSATMKNFSSLKRISAAFSPKQEKKKNSIPFKVRDTDK